MKASGKSLVVWLPVSKAVPKHRGVHNAGREVPPVVSLHLPVFPACNICLLQYCSAFPSRGGSYTVICFRGGLCCARGDLGPWGRGTLGSRGCSSASCMAAIRASRAHTACARVLLDPGRESKLLRNFSNSWPKTQLRAWGVARGGHWDGGRARAMPERGGSQVSQRDRRRACSSAR